MDNETGDAVEVYLANDYDQRHDQACRDEYHSVAVWWLAAGAMLLVSAAMLWGLL